jgi:hypothetical protein
MPQDDTTAALALLMAERDIRHLVAGVARGEDRRDADILRSCFWPEATFNFGIFVGSLPEYLDWVVPGSPAVILTQHALGQTLIQVDGAKATGETHVSSYHRMDFGPEAGHHDVFIGGRYVDLFEQRGAEWRIVQRMMIYDWLQDMGPSADLATGLMGMPYLRGRPVGRTVGDMSEIFFG